MKGWIDIVYVGLIYERLDWYRKGCIDIGKLYWYIKGWIDIGKVKLIYERLDWYRKG